MVGESIASCLLSARVAHSMLCGETLLLPATGPEVPPEIPRFDPPYGAPEKSFPGSLLLRGLRAGFQWVCQRSMVAIGGEEKGFAGDERYMVAGGVGDRGIRERSGEIWSGGDACELTGMRSGETWSGGDAVELGGIWSAHGEIYGALGEMGSDEAVPVPQLCHPDLPCPSCSEQMTWQEAPLGRDPHRHEAEATRCAARQGLPEIKHQAVQCDLDLDSGHSLGEITGEIWSEVGEISAEIFTEAEGVLAYCDPPVQESNADICLEAEGTVAYSIECTTRCCFGLSSSAGLAQIQEAGLGSEVRSAKVRLWALPSVLDNEAWRRLHLEWAEKRAYGSVSGGLDPGGSGLFGPPWDGEEGVDRMVGGSIGAQGCPASGERQGSSAAQGCPASGGRGMDCSSAGLEGGCVRQQPAPQLETPLVDLMPPNAPVVHEDMGKMVNPLLLALALETHPQFSGEDADWETFEREWEEHERMLSAALGGGVPEILLQQELRKSLDGANQLILQLRKELHPGLTCAEFVRELRRQHSCDTSLQDRWAWEDVKFRPKDAARPTLAEWKLFQAEFELRGSRVIGKAWGEEHRLIFRQLPRFWQEEVVKAERKMAKHQFWVRISLSPELAWGDFRGWLEAAIGVHVEGIQQVDNWHLVNCGSKEMLWKCLDHHGSLVSGHQMRVSRMERRLTALEMFNLVTDLLRIRDGVERGCSSGECQSITGMEAKEIGESSQGTGGCQGQGGQVSNCRGAQWEHPAARRIRLRRTPGGGGAVCPPHGRIGPQEAEGQ